MSRDADRLMVNTWIGEREHLDRSS